MIESDKPLCSLLKRSVLSDNIRNILYKIEKGFMSNREFLHILSLNPENFCIAKRDNRFKEIVMKSQIIIPDGIGIVLAVYFLYGEKIRRLAGVDLFQNLLDYAGKRCLTVLLIGGREGLADKIAKCYNRKFSKDFCVGIQGIENIKKVRKKEVDRIKNIVSSIKPYFVFVAFGSPWQEKWIWENKSIFNECVVMGVGGGFDFVGGRVIRAPVFIRRLGLEWLFRLVIQPWRIKRQIRLLIFLVDIFFCKLKLRRK